MTRRVFLLIALCYVLLAVLVALLYRPGFGGVYLWALRGGRLLAVGLAALAFSRAPRPTLPGIVVALLVVEQAVQLVGTWASPWERWELSRVVTLATYLAIGVVMGWEIRSRRNRTRGP